MSKLTLKYAAHNFVPGIIVRFRKSKDILGRDNFLIVHSDGSQTTMSIKQFEETFSEVSKEDIEAGDAK